MSSAKASSRPRILASYPAVRPATACSLVLGPDRDGSHTPYPPTADLTALLTACCTNGFWWVARVTAGGRHWPWSAFASSGWCGPGDVIDLQEIGIRQ